MKKRSAKHKILEALLEARNYPVYWYTKQVPRGWLTTGHICKPEVGGNSGPRRIREMRADGIEIEMDRFFCNDIDGTKQHCFIYCLKTEIALIDLKSGTLKVKAQAA